MLPGADVRLLLPQQIHDDLPPWGQALYELSGPTMGSSWSVRFHGPKGLALERIQAAIEAVLQQTIDQMSHWAPDSVLSRFNRAMAGTRVCLPVAFAQVMSAALQVARASRGAFDPCLGALVDRWGFGPGHLTSLPIGHQTPEALEATADVPAWQRLAWDATQGAITQPGDAMLDLSSIAKGHAVDCLSQRLHELGLRHHLVEVGGELRGAGLKAEGQPWWVDVEPPSADCRLPCHRIALHGLSVATSGDYRRYVMDDQGRRQGHTMDPRRGAPADHGLASVTVVHRSAMWADAWSTALMASGLSEGLTLAERQGLAARLVKRLPTGGFEETLSSAWQAMA